MSKYIIFLVKSFLGNFYWHFAIFFWSHWRVVWLRDIYSYIADTSCLKKSVAGSFCQRKLTLWEVSLYCWLPVNFAWIQLLYLCWTVVLETALQLFKSKPAKQEVSNTVILPPMVSVLCFYLNMCLALFHLLTYFCFNLFLNGPLFVFGITIFSLQFIECR